MAPNVILDHELMFHTAMLRHYSISPNLRMATSRVRAAFWAIIVTFILGVHNFYKGEDKSLDNIVTMELFAEPKDQDRGTTLDITQSDSTGSPGTPAGR
jgi:hypothetical protein